MLRYRVGVAGSGAAGGAMAAYLSRETLSPERDARAAYYIGEVIPEAKTRLEQLGRDLNNGEISYGDALNELVEAELAIQPQGVPIDYEEIEERLGNHLVAAATRADFEGAIAENGGTIAKVRHDINPELAARLGIDPNRQISVGEIGNLLNGLRTDGSTIEGKEIHRPMRSVVDIFGLDGRSIPTPAQVDRVLGSGPHTDSKGEEFPEKIVEGARRRFLAAYGVPKHQDLTLEDIEHIRAGRTIAGLTPSDGDILRKLNSTRTPIAYIDLIWSADKSVTLAWALAPTQAEAAMIIKAHNDATDSAMSYTEERFGFVKKGKDGRDGLEKGSIAWIKFDHYTSRPIKEVAVKDAEGRPYTEFADVPMKISNPLIHTHSTMFNAVLTERGHIGSLYFDQLDGLVKELGAVYQAFLAKNLRQHGIDAYLDRATGAARIWSIPDSVRTHFSERTQAAHDAAKEYASSKGLDWDALTPEHQIALLRAGAERTRLPKTRGGDPSESISDPAAWRAQAEELGYFHRSVLRPNGITPELGQEERRDKAYDISRDFLEDALSRRAKLDGQEFREFAARGLIDGGIDNPGQDISAVTNLHRNRGVQQEGELVALIWGKDTPIRGKDRWSVTTTLHEAAEHEVIELARSVAVDRSAALPIQALDRAARDYLDTHPRIDPNGQQWIAQREMMDRLGTGGRLGVGIGVAGSGKSSMLSPLVDALQHEGGRTVYGLAVSWKQATAIGDAGIAKNNLLAVDGFLRRVEKGQITPDRNTTVIVDELSQVGRRQFLHLLRLQQERGFQIIAIGDPKQAQSIEAGLVIDLLRQALGPKAIPEILTTIRQRTEREREISGLFREGNVAEALTMKREDRTVEIVAGGREATIERTAALWQERTEARGDEAGFRLTVSAPTNADANALGVAIRSQMRDMGRLGEDVITVPTNVRGQKESLPLAVGDMVRVFDRVFMADRKRLANNGDVVEVREVSEKGMLARNLAGDEAFVPWEKLSHERFRTKTVSQVRHTTTHHATPRHFTPRHDTTPHDTPLHNTTQRTNDQETQRIPAVRLAYGYALTVDTSQGITSDEHIDAMPSGSNALHGFKSYVANSRHTQTTWMVVNEAAERKQIMRHIPLGDMREITETDVWRNIASNLSRQPEKASALKFIRYSMDLKRGSIHSVQHGNEPGDRRKNAGRNRNTINENRARTDAERAPVLARLMENMERIIRIPERIIERFRYVSRSDDDRISLER